MKAADAVNDIDKEEYKLQLRNEARELKKQFEQEEQLLAFYQQEREKINYNWIIAKKELEDYKSEHINKEREIQDLKENHIMTLNVYKQKIKHLLFQNQDQQSELKKDVEITLKQLEDEHRIKSRELKTDTRSLKVIKKEQEVSQHDYVMYALNFDFSKKFLSLRQDYERLANDIKKKYDNKMAKLRTEMEEARQALIKQLEEKKDLKIGNIKKEHHKKYQDIKNYYSDITATNLDLIRQLKNEINEHTKNEERDKRELLKAERQWKNLNDPLTKTKEDILKLQKQKIEQEGIIREKENLKQRISEYEEKFRKMEYEYEVKLQQFQYFKRDRDFLFDKFNNTVYDIHQKTGLQNLILEKKVTNIQDDIELKDLCLHQTLVAANIDPNNVGAITRSLEEVEQLKNNLVNELQQQLQQIRKAHVQMIKAYEGKLSEFVIPSEELGFDPLIPSNVE
ncbi:hypothetical protein PPERSA_00071 [Pseudocohnilembus persalinus]|uniref:Growth arrest-specific protein 8 domain-containing protein n=1 Tax=Pseudocohnilembus persalinus TaxID=266149 RepID=A0A0V0QXR5_PSEPJ|nr:hypothetical protein PPERSA_00071 [Pseudocohnilembus persalinus]|eukprot:KRX07161.1 hypothetical protein PPERSA_00071 [Pseudocohnilembus persalinus]